MKRFVRFAIIAGSFLLAFPGWPTSGMQSDEPDQQIRRAVDGAAPNAASVAAWEDEQTPASALCVSNRERSGVDSEWTQPSPRLIGRTRIDAFRDFHQKFVNAFGPSYGFVDGGFRRFRRSYPNEFEVESLTGQSIH